MPVNKLGTTQAAIRGKIAETAETITKESLVKPALEHFGSKVREKMFSANLQKANILRKLSGDAQTKIFSSQTIKFDSSVNAAQKKQINETFTRILKYGTPLQKEIIQRIQNSKILIKVDNGGSGTTGLIDKTATQQKINTQRMNETEALGELQITIDPATFATNKGVEGTLVHETRHAYHQARAISEFSQADKMKRPPYDPDGFEIEYAAHKSYADYVI